MMMAQMGIGLTDDNFDDRTRRVDGVGHHGIDFEIR
jgi:hypothetical protein